MTSRKFFALSVATFAAAAAYPVYMGVVTIISAIKNGFVEAADYPKYIIPYTPLAIALLTAALLMPLLYKKLRRWALPVASLAAASLFFACEIGLEQVRILEGYEILPLDAWQYSLCIATPEVLRSIGEPIYAQNNPAYKVHFYLISLVILLSVSYVFYGYTRMFKDNDHFRKKPLAAQLVCALVFIGLCIYACFTAFYRNGTLDISSLSASLMAAFFIVFGVTFGTYFGCIFYGKRRLLSCWLPAVAAIATTGAMYAGELVLTDGVLFRLGRGAFFKPLGALPFAPADILVILASGALTYLIAWLLNRGFTASSENTARA